MILAHVIGGPADALVELGLPVLVFAALWWWSARGEHRERKTEADGGPKATPGDEERGK